MYLKANLSNSIKIWVDIEKALRFWDFVKKLLTNKIIYKIGEMDLT